MTWVKICGTTNLEDAFAAVESGADAIGFVMAPSKRRITPSAVAEIVRQLPATIEKIGVFLNESPDQVIAAVLESGLTGVQLHGEESPEVVERIADAKVAKVVRGIHAGPSLESDLESWSREKTVNALLLDSGNVHHGGGTGKTFDWDQVASVLENLSPRKPLIVAGGLTPDNVRTAIARFRPWGVDVVSGVESQPGRKDPQKVKAFIAAVRSVQK